MKKIYTSIDIGSDTIKFVVGEYYNGQVNVYATHTIKSKGIRKGLIVDPNLAVNAIKDGVKEINNKLGIEIKKVIVNVPDYNAKFMFVTGDIEIENEDGIVNTLDINKVIKASVYSKLAQEYELVTVVLVNFLVDDKIVDNPVGMTGEKLAIKGIMISTPKKNIYSVVSVITGAGLEVADITVSAIGDYYEVRNPNLDSKVGAIINIGHETTNVSVFNKGKLMNTETIQLGGVNIDKDIAYMFNINVFDARMLKETFASTHKRFSALNDSIIVKNTAGEDIKLNQLEVTEIIMDRLSEILNYAKKQIALLTKQDISYIVVTGGQTEIKSFKNLVFEILGKDVIIYTETTLGARDNKYVTALGMIKYFEHKATSRGREYSFLSKDDEERLLSSKKQMRIDKTILPKIFQKFIGTKEEE